MLLDEVFSPKIFSGFIFQLKRFKHFDCDETKLSNFYLFKVNNRNDKKSVKFVQS